MVLLALKRASASLDWVLIEQFDRLSKQLYREYQQRKSDVDVTRKNKRMRKEEQWTIQRDNEHDTIKIINENDPQTSSSHNNNNNNNNTTTTQQLINIIQTIRTLTTKTLPELSSRIIHATSPILHEISRGFFVPFCTVAISCLGRIHVLVMKFGRELVGILSEHVPKLRECVGTAGGGGGNNAAARGDADLMALADAVTPVFSVVQQTNRKEDSNNNDNDSSYCDEWNALMKQFLEVNHDDLTKSINNFVKERRWKDAMLAFGIKDYGFANDNEMHASSSLNISQDDEKDVDNINETLETDDMGELVYNTQPSVGHDEKISKGSSVDVDDNLARVLQNKKLRSDGVDEAVSVSAKKRRKRKRKKKSAPNDDNVEKNVHDDDMRKEIVNTEREEEIDDENTLKPVEETCQNPTLSKTEAGSDSDEAGLDIKESEAKKQKKDKEKKKKSKKKKKKKSSNVIDDIFG
jgi:hypothetical protein